MLNLGLFTGPGRRRVPVILQTEAAECGLACLAMVASAHGHEIDLPMLRRRFEVSLQGATMADLVRMAAALDLHTRPLRAEPDQLDQLALPCVLHWDLNHFVVLVAVDRGGVRVHDPAHGERRLGWDEVSRRFTGIVLEAVPSPAFRPRTERQPVRLRDLLGPVVGLRRSLLQIGVLALALELFVLGSPFLLQWVVDDVLVSGDRDLLVTLGVGFALLVAMQAATAAARSWAVLVLSASLGMQWLARVFGHLLRLPLAWFERRHVGDVWSRFHAVQQIQDTLTTHFVEALLDGLLVVATLAMMFFYSPLLSAVALAAVLLYGALRWALFRPLRAATEEALVHQARQASHFLESLRGIRAIRLFGAQADRQAAFANRVVDTTNAQLAARKLELWQSVAHRALFGLERVAVVWLGALLVLDGRFSVGMLMAFLAFKEQFAVRVSGLIDKGVELAMLRLQAERLADIALAEPEAEAPASALGAAGSGTARAAGPGAVSAPLIELRDVSFRYADGEPEVLSGLNLRIEAGESVALVGPSGCGKTTLLKLLLGIHAPTRGEVLVDGLPLARVGLAAWRRRLGVVMQDEALFSGSVAENITFFDPQPDDRRLAECARLAAVADEIEALPMGWHTLIGDMGSSLSGGQRQRILLARALYRKPQVLLLDEATSALDVERERLVNQMVRQLAVTRIIVAHRPETVASAQRVVALQDGRIAQDLRSVAAAAG